MGTHSAVVLLVGGAGLAVVVWLLHKLGRALAAIAETLAAAALVFVALWWLVKAVAWLAKQVFIHPRTTLVVLAVAVWCYWLGWPSFAITMGTAAACLAVWRWVDAASFEHRAWRWLRAWWLRWTIYQPQLPGWLHACGLTIRDTALPVAVTVTLVGRRKVRRDQAAVAVRFPKVVSVRSGGSWDEVRVRLVPGQKPEDYDVAARALASARKVARCQVREVAPDVVSIDFQRRNQLADAVPCADLAGLAQVRGESVDLTRAWAGRTEYGHDWFLPLAGPGAHLLGAGATGSGKNSVMWSPLVSVAPALRDGLVRVSGIDPKGMELAYGRRIFSRYAVTAVKRWRCWTT
jgi:S-DNA-T family DNA segregation ATPase FtsK/SpoIIIE